ncbi:MAG: fibronectin type III domain-containing protein [Patescibacteria group bacterium]
MPFTPPQVPVPPKPPAPNGPGDTKRAPEIYVIPEKFYAVALKMKPPFATDQQPIAPPPPPKPVEPPPKPVVPMVVAERTIPWPMIAVAGVILLAVGGGFVYFARDYLFKPPVAPVVVVKPPEAPPAPAGLVAQAPTAQSVSLQWQDVSGLETGYRIERREGEGTYLPVSNLPANSTTFLDTSVEPAKGYQYRVMAIGQGGESAPSDEASVTVPEALAVAPAAPSLPPGGLDTDSDGVTDVEESLYTTDPRQPDSDGDDFLDGNEVFHLYNPMGFAPTKLADTGSIKIFTAPAGWELYVPTAWQTTLNAADGSQATIDSGHGETFVIRIEDNASRIALRDWYVQMRPGTVATEVKTIKTKRGMDGIVDAERMTTYFSWEDKVISIRYDMDGQQYINYRTTYEMMLNSFVLRGMPQVTVPSEATLAPGSFVAPVTTTTAVVVPVVEPESAFTPSATATTVTTTPLAP